MGVLFFRIRRVEALLFKSHCGNFSLQCEADRTQPQLCKSLHLSCPTRLFFLYELMISLTVTLLILN